MNIWTFVGIGSLLWSLIEMITGRAWIHREVKREEQPTTYWVVVLFWLMLGVSCLVPISWN